MARVSAVPWSQMDPELREMARGSDEALGGSEWIQYFCHAPDLYKDLVAFYYKFILAERNGISSRLIELVRRVVAERNQCQL